ncbi:MAG: alpha/beta hydrolase [Verrucomicrobiota bacterium]
MSRPFRLSRSFGFVLKLALAAPCLLPAASDPAPGGVLPPALVTTSGRVVTNAAEWETLRRPEVLELFREHVYGRAPVGRPAELAFVPLGEDEAAFDGLAIRRRVRVAYAGTGSESGIDVTLYLPAAARPRGCFLLIVNRSRRIIDAAEESPDPFWPVRDIVARGYATAAFHNSDAAPDRAADGFKSGVFAHFDSPDGERSPDAWGTIAAWSWGASRVIDWLAAEPELRDIPLAVVGHSRGGKAALWCGAQDERVALTVSNNSGSTGAALARTTRGETIQMINTTFPHWFAANYHRYNDDPASLPVDQHLLLALMAPRRVYVASASRDAHADPAAEFQAAVEAAPVFALYQLDGVGPAGLPAPGQPRHGGAIGHHLREGGHNLVVEDWHHFLDYADRCLPASAGR